MTHRLAPLLFAALLFGCRDPNEVDDAGVGSARDSCGEPGSNSVLVSMHSCACEPGHTWCSDALDEFDCCEVEGETSTETGEAATPPDQACGEDQLEQLACVGESDDPTTGVVWACNGEDWVMVPSYSTFACLDQSFPFAYGCRPGPVFACGHGPGSVCEVETYVGICKDDEIIDTCVWGKRTIDYCARLCGELAAFGSGFMTGSCEQPVDGPATCVCG